MDNPSSQNAYSTALARHVLQNRPFLKSVAAELGELPSDLQSQLKRKLLDKAHTA